MLIAGDSLDESPDDDFDFDGRSVGPMFKADFLKSLLATFITPFAVLLTGAERVLAGASTLYEFWVGTDFVLSEVFDFVGDLVLSRVAAAITLAAKLDDLEVLNLDNDLDGDDSLLLGKLKLNLSDRLSDISEESPKSLSNDGFISILSLRGDVTLVSRLYLEPEYFEL